MVASSNRDTIFYTLNSIQSCEDVQKDAKDS